MHSLKRHSWYFVKFVLLYTWKNKYSRHLGFRVICCLNYVKIEKVSWNGISYNWFCYIRDNWKSLIKWDFVHFVVVKYVKIETLASLRISYTSCYYIRENWNTIIIWEFVHTVMLYMWTLKHSRHIGFRKICVVKYVK